MFACAYINFFRCETYIMKHFKSIETARESPKVSIAVTGGIGSGKSVVCEELKKLGYPVFSCDQIYRDLTSDCEYLKELAAIFPGTVSKDKVLDRKKLSKIVFNNPSALKKLNALAHPLVMQKLKEHINSKQGMVFSEVPLLFEGGFEADFDFRIIVLREYSKRVQWISRRDSVTEKEAITRIAAQFNYEKYFSAGYQKNEKEFLIFNDGSIDDLRLKIVDVLKSIFKTMKQ